MFAKDKVSQAMVDAVKQVVETAPIKEPTPTGMRVYGGSYGNSAKAKQDQTKSAVDTLKGPKAKEMKEAAKPDYLDFDKDGNKKEPMKKALADKEKSVKEELKGDQYKIDANHNNKIDGQDFKILKGKKKVKEDMTFAKKLLEVAKADIPAYLRKQKGEKPLTMADVKEPRKDSISAPKNLAKARNEWKEEVELEEAVSRKDFQMVADLIKTHDNHDKRKELATHHAEIFHRQNPRFDRAKFMKAANVNENFEQVEENHYQEVDAPITTDTLAGRMPGGKSNSFKSFKMRVKPLDKEGDDAKEVPSCDTPEKTSARASIHAEETELDEMINEVLSKDATAGDWIHDFVHSDNPKFAGKSKAERKKMALGAYYGKQNEESLNEYSMDDLRKDADAHIKKSIDKASDDRIRNLKKPKSFLQKVGDKQIGMIKGAFKGAVKGLRGESVELEEGQMKRLATDKEEDARKGAWKVETPWKKSTDTVTDKSGAQHTPMSRARDLARQAFKKVQDKTKIKAN